MHLTQVRIYNSVSTSVSRRIFEDVGMDIEDTPRYGESVGMDIEDTQRYGEDTQRYSEDTVPPGCSFVPRTAPLS